MYRCLSRAARAFQDGVLLFAPVRVHNTKVFEAQSVQTELWTSWASLLRSYAAAHGLNATQHAVVEVSRDAIILRVGARWLRFTHTEVEGSDLGVQPFRIHEDGTVLVGTQAAEEMDMAAERFARELLTGVCPFRRRCRSGSVRRSAE